ncbi:hypothetical protein ABT063_06220 [Streptomyces sp. NPDC002838]|uniref:hypothetical protein n=1 Tax=Streptomyces sp. NPDC002838 TaxID=3154436 RepID=UPI00331F0D53
MNTTSDHPSHTDDELAEFDVTVLLRYGLTAAPGPRRTALFGDGAAAAAVILDRLGTQPRSVAFLAEVVRAGGVAYAVELPEPLPRPEAAAVVRDWLEAATQLVPQQATFAPSRRPARPLAAPAESPSTSRPFGRTTSSGRHAESTHRTPLLEGQTLPGGALAGGAPADEAAARWLGAVATIIEVKHLTRARAARR